MSNVFRSNSIFLRECKEEENSLPASHHSYYTRSTARKYNSPVSIVNTFQRPVAITTSKKLNRKLARENSFDSIYYLSSKFGSDVSNSSVNIGINTDEIKMPLNPCYNPCVPSKKLFFKAIQLVLFLGLLSLLISHMIERFGETNSSFRFIKEELDDIKTSLESLNHLQVSLKTINIKITDNHKELQNEINTLRNLMENNTENQLNELKTLVSESLETYDADKTGQTDFALESSGGSIASIKNTVTYTSGANTLSVFGIPLCSSSQNARVIIQPSSLPGECWAIAGSTGSVVIQLLGRVIVTGVSLEHIPASISPTGEITTAPKDFGVFGLAKPEDDDGHLIGRYTYNINGSPVQYFPSENKHSFLFVELKIFSNHGHPEYTCIYRLRVHGHLETSVR